MVLPKHYADVWDQGHSFLTYLPPSVHYSWPVIYYTATSMTGQLDESSQVKDLAVFLIWPNHLRTSNAKTDKEIELGLSASYFSLKSAFCGLQGIRLFSLRYESVAITDLTLAKVKCNQSLWGRWGLGIEIRGSCVPHLRTLIIHEESNKRKKSEVGEFPPLFLAFVVVSHCSFGDSGKGALMYH